MSNPIGYCRECGSLRIYQPGQQCPVCRDFIPLPRADWQRRNDMLAYQNMMRQRGLHQSMGPQTAWLGQWVGPSLFDGRWHG